ncbi:YIP1 family protein [Haladaptatus salinisoli]|uniref:YIP1 family protein n=1 Tax=Haladaptatus salinisoli TaxID=2884876 RepID=UPI001D0B4EE7|nr:YIP1 family protein [Haladaptatus salinisoli]
MTQWVENPTGGRDRGPQAVLRAWVEVMVRPRRFFNTGVAPGDQAPGMVFGVLVTLTSVASRMAFGELTVGDVAGSPLLTKLLALALVGLFVAPLVLHLTAALQTVILMVLVPNRAGISETVQVIGYSVAPCLFAGLPAPELRVVCTLYGALLLVVGVKEVHHTSYVRAALAAALPAALVFGYGFGGKAALEILARSAAVPW